MNIRNRIHTNKSILWIVLIAILFSPASCIAKDEIPSSTRSREVIHRIKPRIVKELSDKDLSFGASIFVRIFKEEKIIEVWLKSGSRYKLFKTYPVCTYGFGGLGPKVKRGDGKAPEGFYFVRPASLNPVSNFHLSFNLGYPNSYDRYHGRTGSALMVHGSCVSIGCYAMTDSGIEEIYTLVDAALRNGQPFFRVHIFPFKMNAKSMEKHKENKWYEFWSNLKEGYDFFENNNKLPPNVKVLSGKYVFE